MQLGQASDEELEAVYTDLGFDGTWSLTTKLSIMAAEAQGLPVYLNYLWAVTPQTYRCPVCQRAKPQLVNKLSATRTGKKEERLLAQLCLDHDHLIDLANALADAQGLQADLRHVYDACMRFPPTIICHTCNAIDSRAKVVNRGIDTYFTFTPEEKAQLFKPFHRTKHWINQAKADAFWEERAAAHRAKVEALPRMIQDAFTGLSHPYHYKRYVDDGVKERFYGCSPWQEPQAFHTFIKRSTAHGSCLPPW